MLEDEDFIDDTKDAGELGSGHTVTALYEVIPLGVKSDYLKDVSDLKYTKKEVANNFSDELFTVKFRYKKPKEDQSIEIVHIHKTDAEKHISTDFQFAASVAWYGMKLRNSEYIQNQNTEDIITLAKKSRGNDEQGYRAEFVRLMSSYDKANQYEN
jgi:Ca-activated chloride channel family protein